MKIQTAPARCRLDWTRRIRFLALSWWRIGLALLVALGALLRLGALSMMEFRHDSAYWALDAYRALTSGEIPLVGQQVGSVDIELHNGPIMTYLTAIVFWPFGYDPEAVAFLIAACNVLGIYLTYLLGKRLYSREAGLIAAALMTTAPWLVLYGRMLWPQALFPFVIPLSLLILITAIERGGARWFLLYGVILGVGLQLHLSVLALIGAGLLFVIIYSRDRRMVIPVGAGSLIGYAPIILYDTLHGFPNLKALAQLPTLHASDESRFTHVAKTLWDFSNVLSGQGLWVSKIGDSPYLPSAADWAQGIVLTVLFAGAIMGVVVHHLRRIRETRELTIPYQDGLLLLFFALPFAYLLLSRSAIERHYFIFFFPIPFLIIARAFHLWRQRGGSRSGLKSVRVLIPAVVALVCVLNLATVAYGYEFIRDRGGEAAYGTTLADKQRAVDYIVGESGGSYRVSVESVQETLPYVFLFETRGSITVEGDENHASAIGAEHADRRVREYAIAETPYHAVPDADDATEVFRSRGVVVIGLTSAN